MIRPPADPVLPMTILCVVVGLLAVPLILGKVPPNRAYGVRTPATLKDPEVWYKANTFGGWCMLAAAVVSVVGMAVAKEALGATPVGVVSMMVIPQFAALLATLAYIRRIR